MQLLLFFIRAVSVEIEPVSKVLLDGLYDVESNLAKLRGCQHVMKLIWEEVVVHIIMITRPWPAFGRHGLAGSSGGDQFWRKKLLTFSLAPSALRSVGIDHREVISFHMYN